MGRVFVFTSWTGDIGIVEIANLFESLWIKIFIWQPMDGGSTASKMEKDFILLCRAPLYHRLICQSCCVQYNGSRDERVEGVNKDCGAIQNYNTQNL